MKWQAEHLSLVTVPCRREHPRISKAAPCGACFGVIAAERLISL